MISEFEFAFGALWPLFAAIPFALLVEKQRAASGATADTTAT